MKEKGFTLIELLAVIVILAIIALIAVPMVLDTIEKSRKGAASSGTYSYVSEVEAKLATYMLKNTGSSYSEGKYSVARLKNDLNIELKGTTPTEGNVCIGSNGTVVEASLKMNNYIVHYDGKNATTTELTDIEDIACNGTTIPEVTLYPNGTPVYFNPESGTLCSESEAVSTTETKTGCMKWYTFNDNSTSSTVNMILDHNTTATVAWVSQEDYIAEGGTEEEYVGTNREPGNNSKGPITVEKQLRLDTKDWKVQARLITADEVAHIVGADIVLNFDSARSNANEWFILDGATGTDVKWQTQVITTQGASKYAWLYDYTYDCTIYGCNVADSSNSGYWTSTAVFNTLPYVWKVCRNGTLRSYEYVANPHMYGVRPVITISKAVLNG